MSKTERCPILLLVFGTMLLFIFSLPFVSSNIAGYLERDYQSYDKSVIKQLDVIVVLAGGLKRGHGTVADELTGSTYSRTVAGVRAFKLSNARLIVMSGGTGDIKDTRMVDAMRFLAVEMGAPADQVRVDPLSRNTFEHPLFLLKLRGISSSDKIGVVTAAWHMRRAIGEFERYFPNCVAIPCNYSGAGANRRLSEFVPNVGALGKNTTILHEYIGRCWYQIRHAWERE